MAADHANGATFVPLGWRKPFSDQSVQKTSRGVEHVTHEDITPEQEEAERSKPAGRTKLTRLFVVLLVLLAWFGLAGVGGPLVGRLSEVQKNDNASFLPKSAESTEVGKLAAKFSSTDALPYFVVIERPTGLNPSDADAVESFIAGIPSLPFEIEGYSLGPYLAAPPVAAVPSQDGKALLLSLIHISEP